MQEQDDLRVQDIMDRNHPSVYPDELVTKARAILRDFKLRILPVIDDDKKDLFLHRTWSEQHPSACPFLRPAKDCVLCTIHETSPNQCKSYRCIVMKIFNANGDIIGTVTGTLALHSDNADLRAIWEESERVLQRSPHDMEAELAKLLEGRGYRVE
jgi:CBS domain-containing protein